MSGITLNFARLTPSYDFAASPRADPDYCDEVGRYNEAKPDRATVLWLLIFAASFGTRGAWDEALRCTWVAAGGEPGAASCLSTVSVPLKSWSTPGSTRRYTKRPVSWRKTSPRSRGVTPAIVGEPTGRSPCRLHLMTLGRYLSAGQSVPRSSPDSGKPFGS